MTLVTKQLFKKKKKERGKRNKKKSKIYLLCSLKWDASNTSLLVTLPLRWHPAGYWTEPQLHFRSLFAFYDNTQTNKGCGLNQKSTTEVCTTETLANYSPGSSETEKCNTNHNKRTCAFKVKVLPFVLLAIYLRQCFRYSGICFFVTNFMLTIAGNSSPTF